MPSTRQIEARRARGALFTQALRAVTLLTERPRRAAELAELLGVSESTAKRLVSGVREAGLPLKSRREGREVYHFLPGTGR